MGGKNHFNLMAHARNSLLFQNTTNMNRTGQTTDPFKPVLGVLTDVRQFFNIQLLPGTFNRNCYSFDLSLPVAQLVLA